MLFETNQRHQGTAVLHHSSTKAKLKYGPDKCFAFMNTRENYIP